MELRHLRYFVAVAEELNFRRAAERLHVSGPALSKQVRELEEEVGARLLERNTVRVSLTEPGSLFLEDARKLLADLEKAVRRAAEAGPGKAVLRIGSVGPIATEFLPKALKAYRQRSPEVEISFVEVPPPEQAVAVSRGAIDIAFGYGRQGTDDDGLQSLCVIRAPFGVVVSAQHPLAGRSELGLEDLKEQAVFSVGRDYRSSHRENLLRLWSEENLAAPKLQNVENFDAVLNLIAADQGVSLLPQVMNLRAHGIVMVPLRALRCDPEFRMWVLWKKGAGTAAVAQFVAVLEEMFPA